MHRWGKIGIAWRFEVTHSLGVGTLVLLALARLFVAPEPSAATPPPEPSADAALVAPSPEETTSQTPLLPIDFRARARALDASRPAYDLRNPFRASTVKASAPHAATTPSERGTPAKHRRASARRHDLRDPFAESPRRRSGQAKPAEDLRDPFSQPPPALPKCPDTGGVPIQRPDTVRAGCAQASRRFVLAHR